jgi:hypothetical protein
MSSGLKICDDITHRAIYLFFLHLRPSFSRILTLFSSQHSTMVVHEERVLLPQKLYPTSYDITLTPDLQRFTFTGSVSGARALSTSLSLSVSYVFLNGIVREQKE